MTPFLLLVALGIATAVVTAMVMRSRESASATHPPAPVTPPPAPVAPSSASEETSTPAPPARRRSVEERTLASSPYADVTPEQAARNLRFVRRARRRSLVGSVVAGVVLGLATGAFPVALWVDSRTVPAGAETTEVTVEGYLTSPTAMRSGARPSARTVQVTPTVDGLDRVTLEYRWLWPDAGDTLEVYPEDGDLRSTEEAGTLHLVGGLAMASFWTWATVGWVRHRRRQDRDREARWERLSRPDESAPGARTGEA